MRKLTRGAETAILVVSLTGLAVLAGVLGMVAHHKLGTSDQEMGLVLRVTLVGNFLIAAGTFVWIAWRHRHRPSDGSSASKAIFAGWAGAALAVIAAIFVAASVAMNSDEAIGAGALLGDGLVTVAGTMMLMLWLRGRHQQPHS
jgi:hypothetical protein